MSERLYTNRLTLISFCLSFSGSALGLATAQYGFLNHMNDQMWSWREAMLQMRRRLEIGGGVPFLLRDEVYKQYCQVKWKIKGTFVFHRTLLLTGVNSPYPGIEDDKPGVMP